MVAPPFPATLLIRCCSNEAVIVSSTANEPNADFVMYLQYLYGLYQWDCASVTNALRTILTVGIIPNEMQQSHEALVSGVYSK